MISFHSETLFCIIITQMSDRIKKKSSPRCFSQHRGLLFTFIIQHHRFDLAFFGLGVYIIMGLTPFLYLHNNGNDERNQDGRITIFLLIISFKQEICQLLAILLLTDFEGCGMINMLGGLTGGSIFIRREPNV